MDTRQVFNDFGVVGYAYSSPPLLWIGEQLLFQVGLPKLEPFFNTELQRNFYLKAFWISDTKQSLLLINRNVFLLFSSRLGLWTFNWFLSILVITFDWVKVSEAIICRISWLAISVRVHVPIDVSLFVHARLFSIFIYLLKIWKMNNKETFLLWV